MSSKSRHVDLKKRKNSRLSPPTGSIYTSHLQTGLQKQGLKWWDLVDFGFGEYAPPPPCGTIRGNPKYTEGRPDRRNNSHKRTDKTCPYNKIVVHYLIVAGCCVSVNAKKSLSTIHGECGWLMHYIHIICTIVSRRYGFRTIGAPGASQLYNPTRLGTHQKVHI